IKMEKFLTNTDAGWRQLSLPLAGTLGGFDDIEILGTNHPTVDQRNAIYWDATLGGTKAKGWTTADLSDNQDRGYSFYNTSGGLHKISQTISFTGTYDDNDRDFDIKYTEDSNGTG